MSQQSFAKCTCFPLAGPLSVAKGHLWTPGLPGAQRAELHRSHSLSLWMLPSFQPVSTEGQSARQLQEHILLLSALEPACSLWHPFKALPTGRILYPLPPRKCFWPGRGLWETHQKGSQLNHLPCTVRKKWLEPWSLSLHELQWNFPGDIKILTDRDKSIWLISLAQAPPLRPHPSASRGAQGIWKPSVALLHWASSTRPNTQEETAERQECISIGKEEMAKGRQDSGSWWVL